MAVSAVTSLAPVISLLVISVLLQGCYGTTTTTSAPAQAPHRFDPDILSATIPYWYTGPVIKAMTTATGPEVFSLQGASNDTFAISGTGIVSMLQPFDCDDPSETWMLITSVSGDVTPRTATATLQVRVIDVDVNVNSPVFAQTAYTATVQNVPGMEIMIVQATDADCTPANNAIRYDIIPPNPAGLVVDKDNGTVSLPFEPVTGYFEGVVVASDNGGLQGSAGIAVTVYSDCGSVPTIANGTVTLNGSTSYGASANLTCDRGFRPRPRRLNCTVHGQWQPLNASCEQIFCPDLETPLNGTVIIEDTTVDSMATFGSMESKTIVSRYVKHSEIRYCGGIPRLDYGTVFTNTGTLTFGSDVIFSCDPGYELSHTDTLTCNANGFWNGTVPTCDAKDCGALVTPSDGQISVGLTTYDAVRTFTCNTGYNLNGASSIRCTETGAWSGTVPTCVIVDCGDLNAPNDGSIDSVGGTTVGATVRYSCDAGFRLNGDVYRACLASGAWSGTVPTCVIVDCGGIPRLDYGTVFTNTGTLTFGSDVIFSCDPGYELSHTDTLTCNANGFWNGTVPTCDAKDCGALVTPSDGQISVGLTTYDAVRTFTCNTGYNLNGASSIRCTETGAWSGTVPTCVIVDCGDLNAPNDGSIDSVGGTTVGATVRYSCDAGFRLNGDVYRACLASGAWGGVPATCVLENCGSVPTIANGTVTLNGRTSYGASANLTCDRGFRPRPRRLNCTVRGQWLPLNASCEQIFCPDLEAPLNGTVIIEETTVDSMATFGCDAGFDLSGNAILWCRANGNWSAPPPTCDIRDCGAIPRLDYGSVSYTNTGTTFGSDATFSCDPGYELSHTDTLTCNANGFWNGTAPTCDAKGQPVTQCKATQDERETTWAEALPNQVKIVECPSGFTGNATRKCNAQGNWEPPLYNCERQKVIEVKEQAAALNRSSTAAEVQDVLQTLVELTNETTVADVAANDKLTQSELESVATSLQDVADSLTEAKVDDTIEQDFFEAASHMIDTPNRDTWKTLGDSGSEGAEKVIKAVDTMTGIVIDKFRASGGTSKVITKKNIVVEVVKVENEDLNFPDLSASHLDWQNSTTRAFLPNSAMQGNNVVATGVIFRNMSEITSAEQSSADASAKEINGPVVAITISPPPGRLNPPLRLEFEHTLSGYNQPSCSFWEETGNTWSTFGCSVVSSNATMTVCECDHLTNFAVLMSPFVEADAESTGLRVVSIVGIGISIVCLVLTMAVHFYLWRYLRSDRTTILMHLCVAILASYVLFLAGVDRTESRELCAVIAVLLQYIYLVVFCVMLAEGIEIGVLLLFVFVKRSRIKLLMTAAWVLPAIIVGISLGVSKAEGYGNDNFCWLSLESGLIWAFVGPALAIILFNLVCLCFILKVMFSTKTMEQKTNINKVKAGVRSLGILIPLMGVTWIIGIFYINEDFYWIQYIFAICNGLQGFFIFLFHCLLNKEIRNAWAAQKRRKLSTDMKSTTPLRNTEDNSSNDMSNTYLGKSNDSEDNRKYNVILLRVRKFWRH